MGVKEERDKCMKCKGTENRKWEEGESKRMENGTQITELRKTRKEGKQMGIQKRLKSIKKR